MATNLPFTGNFRVTCEYGRRGTAWKSGVHGGIDLVGADKKVYSICNGKVVYAGWENSSNKKQGFGLYVKIQEAGTNKFIYLAHLSSLNVKTGQSVSRTSVVGIMGSTGNSTGPHTHVEIRENGKKLNPANYIGIPNKVGSYNSANYQLQSSSSNSGSGVIKRLARNTNLRKEPSTQKNVGEVCYLANTSLTVLQSNVANVNGYTWDKVKIAVNGKEGYMINKNYR